MNNKLLLILLTAGQMCIAMPPIGDSILNSPSKQRNLRQEMISNAVDPQSLDFSSAVPKESESLDCPFCMVQQNPNDVSVTVFACEHDFICANCKDNCSSCIVCQNDSKPGYSATTFKKLCLNKNYICHACEDPLLATENIKILDCEHAFHLACLPREESYQCTTCAAITPASQEKTPRETHTFSPTILSQKPLMAPTAPKVQRNVDGAVLEENRRENQIRIKSKLSLYASEGIGACLIGLLTRSFFDKGLLTHEKSPERNTSWSVLLGAILVAQKALDKINPERQANQKAVHTSWLVGGLLGLGLPSLMPSQNNNR